jgi:zinc finger protein
LLDLTKTIDANEDLKHEALSFTVDCNQCFRPGVSRTCIITIPYFKELLISCFKCEFNSCGYKNVEIKGGGGIAEKAKKITLKITKPSDLNRDLFKVFI